MRQRLLQEGGVHLQEAATDHGLDSSINAPVQLDSAEIQEEAAEVIVQGGLHIQIQLPQGAAGADEDLQHPVQAIPIPRYFGQPADALSVMRASRQCAREQV